MSGGIRYLETVQDIERFKFLRALIYIYEASQRAFYLPVPLEDRSTDDEVCWIHSLRLLDF